MNNNLKILYEDNHIIVADKQSGLLSQGDISGNETVLDLTREYIKVKYNKPGKVYLGLVHRLDKPASGIIIMARTSKAASRLQSEFLNRKVRKFYLALVDKHKENNDWITLNSLISSQNGFSGIAEKQNINAKEATLKYKVICSNNKYSLLLINLITGRKHQIRLQLSHSGYPLVGDILYGSNDPIDDDSICLTSYYLGLQHPVKKNFIEFFSSIPENISSRIEVIKGIETIVKLP